MNEENVGGRNSWLCPIVQICTQSEWGLLWTETHSPSKFCGKLFSSFSCNLFKIQSNKERMLLKCSYHWPSIILSWWGCGVTFRTQVMERVGAVHGPSSAGVVVLTNRTAERCQTVNVYIVRPQIHHLLGYSAVKEVQHPYWAAGKTLKWSTDKPTFVFMHI